MAAVKITMRAVRRSLLKSAGIRGRLLPGMRMSFQRSIASFAAFVVGAKPAFSAQDPVRFAAGAIIILIVNRADLFFGDLAGVQVRVVLFLREHFHGLFAGRASAIFFMAIAFDAEARQRPAPANTEDPNPPGDLAAFIVEVAGNSRGA